MIEQTPAVKEYVENLQFSIEQNNKHVAKFTSDVEKDPYEAMSWSKGTLEIIATLQAQKHVLLMLESDEMASIQKVYDTVLRRVVADAKYPEHSSSPISNLMKQFLTAGYSQQLEYLKGLCYNAN